MANSEEPDTGNGVLLQKINIRDKFCYTSDMLDAEFTSYTRMSNIQQWDIDNETQVCGTIYLELKWAQTDGCGIMGLFWKKSAELRNVEIVNGQYAYEVTDLGCLDMRNVKTTPIGSSWANR